MQIHNPQSLAVGTYYYDELERNGDSVITNAKIDVEPSTIFVDGNKCVYATTGKPSPVFRGYYSNTAPQKFIRACNGDETKALEKWKKSQEWRLNEEIWQIFSLYREDPNNCRKTSEEARRRRRMFSLLKESYPHFWHGTSKDGCPVSYEISGKMKLRELFGSELEIEDMLFHTACQAEFVHNVLFPFIKSENEKQQGDRAKHMASSPGAPQQDPAIYIVIDLNGLRLKQLMCKSIITYLIEVGISNDANYPFFVQKLFCINCKPWFVSFFNSMKWALPAGLKEAIHFIPKEKESSSLKQNGNNMILKTLTQFIDIEEIPVEYGGKSAYPVKEHPYERAFCEMALLGGDGVPKTKL